MIDVDHWIGNNNSDIKMIMQVHDELIFEVKKGFAEEASSAKPFFTSKINSS